MEGKKYNLLYGNKRFGMFIHWGVYALTEWHEQYLMRMPGAAREEYEKLIHQFDPVLYDPREWVRLAKDAGMKYICFTTKHHDGFCMWDTKQTDYNIMHTPYGKDVLKMLSEACEEYGLELALYYSNPDWHHKNAYNPFSTHQIPPRDTDEPDSIRYREFVKAQITELLTGYGKISGFFWDIPPKIYDPQMNELVRSLQPGIRINDRGYDEGDFATPEREVPGGFFTKLTEACESVGRRSWGYRSNEDYYCPRTLCRNIDTILTAGGNYLLNVGPMADGQIPKESLEIIRKVGAWYNQVKESYEDTQYFMEFSDAGCKATIRDNIIYLHFSKGLDATGVVLPPLQDMPEKVTILGMPSGDSFVSYGTSLNPEDTGKAPTFQWAVEILPRVWSPEENKIPYLHIYNLPAEKTIGYPVVLKLEFAENKKDFRIFTDDKFSQAK